MKFKNLNQLSYSLIGSQTIFLLFFAFMILDQLDKFSFHNFFGIGMIFIIANSSISIILSIIILIYPNLVNRAIIFQSYYLLSGPISTFISFAVFSYIFFALTINQMTIFSILGSVVLLFFVALIVFYEGMRKLDDYKNLNIDSGKLDLKNGLWDFQKPFFKKSENEANKGQNLAFKFFKNGILITPVLYQIFINPLPSHNKNLVIALIMFVVPVIFIYSVAEMSFIVFLLKKVEKENNNKIFLANQF